MEIRNSIILYDNMSPVLNKVVTSLRHTLGILQSTAGETALFNQTERDIFEAQEALNKFNSTLKKTEQQLHRDNLGFDEGGLFSKALMPFTETLALLELLNRARDTVKEIVQTGDTIILSSARINTMNNGLMETAEIQKMIYEYAQRARADYIATGNAVTRMGILAGQAFTDATGKLNVEELIKFNELINRGFVVGGSTSMEQKSAMYQLTQAMASDRLQGDEMRAIRESAPLLRNSIRDYMGLDEESFKKAQKNGEITAEIVKNAVFASADSINEAFQKMPLTAEQSWTMTKNAILFNLQELFVGASNVVVNSLQWIAENIQSVGEIALYVGTFSLLLLGRNLLFAFTAALPHILATTVSFVVMNATLLAITAVIIAVIKLLLRFPAIMGNIVGSISAFGTAFLNVLKMVADYFILVINEVIIAGINKVLEAVNKQKIKNLDYYGLESVSDSFNRGYTRGTGFINNINSSLDDFTSSFKNTFKFANIKDFTTPPITKIDVGDVDNIKGGTVTLDEKSIKWLNEAGAVQFVNRYTTMRPIINATFGDIHETADVEQIADKLIEMVEKANDMRLED